MQVTVLGTSGSYPGPHKACSGFLVTEGDDHLLLDCGPGVLAGLQVHLPMEDLTGIIISHMHPDHFLDLIVMRYALVYGSHPRPSPLPLYLPPGGKRIWERMVEPLTEVGNNFSRPFDLREYGDSSWYALGALKVRPAPLKHYIPSYGFEICASGRLVHSGDTRPCAELLSLAHQADLFLCEATWLEDEAPLEKRGHLTAREAGEIAQEADVRRLLLTHVSPDVDSQKSLEAARGAFSGEVLLAQEGQTYTVSAE